MMLRSFINNINIWILNLHSYAAHFFFVLLGKHDMFYLLANTDNNKNLFLMANNNNITNNFNTYLYSKRRSLSKLADFFPSPNPCGTRVVKK